MERFWWDDNFKKAKTQTVKFSRLWTDSVRKCRRKVVLEPDTTKILSAPSDYRPVKNPLIETPQSLLIFLTLLLTSTPEVVSCQ